MTRTAIHFYDVPTLTALLPRKHETSEYVCGIEYVDIDVIKAYEQVCLFLPGTEVPDALE